MIIHCYRKPAYGNIGCTIVTYLFSTRKISGMQKYGMVCGLFYMYTLYKKIYNIFNKNFIYTECISKSDCILIFSTQIFAKETSILDFLKKT